MKKRIIIGAICIIAAFAVTFVLSPFLSKKAVEKTTVIRLREPVREGDLITEAAMEKVDVLKDSLPKGAITDPKDALGKTASATLFKGDILTAEKLSENGLRAETVFKTLPEGKMAVAFSAASFSAGFSGKTENGDIISIFVTDKQNGISFVPAELRYVRVITATTNKGIDQEDFERSEDGSLPQPDSITVLLTEDQARVLVGYERSASLHVALVCRGNDSRTEELLRLQEEVMEAMYAEMPEETEDESASGETQFDDSGQNGSVQNGSARNGSAGNASGKDKQA